MPIIIGTGVIDDVWNLLGMTIYRERVRKETYTCHL